VAFTKRILGVVFSTQTPTSMLDNACSLYYLNDSYYMHAIATVKQLLAMQAYCYYIIVYVYL